MWKYFFALAIVTGCLETAAADEARFYCVDVADSSHVAELKLPFGGGREISWNEPWHSAASAGVYESSAGFKHVYNLKDFFVEGDKHHTLTIEVGMLGGMPGQAVVSFGGEAVETYRCSQI